MLLLLAILTTAINAGGSAAQSETRVFPQTNHAIKGRFLAYWQANGGLMSFGYPISDVTQEVSPLDSKTYAAQYFERAEFELHPENQPPYDVLLAQLGTVHYHRLYPIGAPAQHPASDNPYLFTETNHAVGGKFLAYWQQHGGLTRFGYPISDEFLELSTNGKLYTVQYFERAVMELHAENQPPYDVLLSQIGRFEYDAAQGHMAAPTFNLPCQYSDQVSYPKISNAHIVWVALPDLSVGGCNLTTEQTIFLSSPAANSVAIDGSIAVWDYGATIVARDIDSDETYQVAASDAGGGHPAISGRTVVWVSETDDGKFSRLLSKSLDSPEISVIDSISTTNRYAVTNPLISPEYIVWADNSYYQYSDDYILKAYNRKTGETTTLSQGHAGDVIYFTLNHDRMVWFDYRAHYINLTTGQHTDLNIYPQFVAISGDYLAWKDNGPDVHTPIHVMRFSDGREVSLPKSGDNVIQRWLALDGDLVVWSDYTGSDKLMYASLSQLFGATSASPLLQ